MWLIILQSPPDLTGLSPGFYDTQNRERARQRSVRVGIAVLIHDLCAHFFPVKLNTKDSNFK